MYRIDVDVLFTLEETRRITYLACGPAQDMVVTRRVEFLIERKMLQVRPSNVFGRFGTGSLDQGCWLQDENAGNAIRPANGLGISSYFQIIARGLFDRPSIHCSTPDPRRTDEFELSSEQCKEQARIYELVA